MTDPTPTRAEVEHHPRPDVTDLTVQEWAAYRCDDAGAVARKLLAENQALRERADAAERERDGAIQWRNHYRQSWLDCRDALTEARRAEAAAWNDAIEAAASVYLNGSSPNTWDYFSLARHEIRALRRAVPTEDR